MSRGEYSFAPQVLTDDNMVEVLQHCEQRLRVVLEVTSRVSEAAGE
jgi:phosphotransferase system IIB component